MRLSAIVCGPLSLGTAPRFWERSGLVPRLLEPLGWGYAAAGAMRRALVHPWRAPVPVICIGNLVAGGAGKTPVALSLAAALRAHGCTPHFLTRGHGGNLAGPIAVDPARHGFAEVGDEALLLAAAGPTWVARDRAAGARAAVAAGAPLLILDDGFQNPALAQDLALLVIDGTYGFGNGRVIPAGPLREPASEGLARAHGVILMGPDERGIAAMLDPATPLLRARLAPVAGGDWSGRRLLAFAGIGRPAKFFATLERMGAVLVGRHAFPDHHAYDEATLGRLIDAAAAADARAVTTAKDWVRLPAALKPQVEVLPIAVEWADGAALEALLERILPLPRHG